MTTRAQSTIIKRGQHNWLEKEYMVAIYMALHSDECKIGLYNIEQCAFLFGIRPNTMKSMIDNFKAYAGKNNMGVGRTCPKMMSAFEKYKVISKEQLKQMSVDYFEKRWNRQRGNIDITRYVNSVGKSAFVQFYELFELASKDADNLEHYINQLPEEWSSESRKMRVVYSSILFQCKRDKDALELIIRSSKLNKDIVDKAKKLLAKKTS